jgi:hypothetical protein
MNPETEIRSRHWLYKMIPAGEWRRSKYPTSNSGKSTTEPRPHIIPITEPAKRMVVVDSAGFIGSTGLCPGELLYEGNWTEGYRVIKIEAAAIPEMLEGLDRQVETIFMPK